MIKEYPYLDATELATLIRKGELQPREVIESAIECIERLNPKLNAVVARRFEAALETTHAINLQAPFAGVPFLLKDLGLDLQGSTTTNGSRLATTTRATSDSELVRRYKTMGLNILGKTNAPEFGIMGVTEPKLWGPCRNPWDLQRTPGGSSGGSASAVAARMVPVASADDGGGSIRIPASACGLFGLKPSRGLISMGPPKTEGWHGLACPHILSRSVRDSALILKWSQGPTKGAPYGPRTLSPRTIPAGSRPRIAFTTKSLFGTQTESSCIQAVKQTLSVCESLGFEVHEDLPVFSKEELIESYLTLVAACTAGEIQRLERETGQLATLETIEHASWFLKVLGEKLSAARLEQALWTTRQTTLLWDDFFERYDFFVTPTMAYEPSPIGLMDMSLVERLAIGASAYFPLEMILHILKTLGARGMERTPNTAFFNLSGHPAMSVPTYWTEQSLPIGVQFVGRFGAEEDLLALAQQLEDHYQWQKRIPPLVSQ